MENVGKASIDGRPGAHHSKLDIPRLGRKQESAKATVCPSISPLYLTDTARHVHNESDTIGFGEQATV